jgi:hypothetical protein
LILEKIAITQAGLEEVFYRFRYVLQVLYFFEPVQ